MTFSVSLTEQADFYEMEYAAKLGCLLPSASARALEKVLQVNPNDLVSRARLLGYYWKRYGIGDSLTSEESRMRVAHILWFIENAPDCIFAGNYYLSCDLKRDPECYAAVKRSWEAHLAGCGGDLLQSRINYALFLLAHERDLSTRILSEVQVAAPANKWATVLLSESSQIEEFIRLSETESAHAHTKKFAENSTSIARSAKETLSRCNFSARISRETVLTQEKILIDDPTDIWARLDILRWCQKNYERANLINLDPEVVFRWYRHAHWLIANTFQSTTLIHDFGLTFGFDLKLPARVFEILMDAMSEKINTAVEPETSFLNAIYLLRSNLDDNESRKFFQISGVGRSFLVRAGTP